MNKLDNKWVTMELSIRYWVVRFALGPPWPKRQGMEVESADALGQHPDLYVRTRPGGERPDVKKYTKVYKVKSVYLSKIFSKKRTLAL